MSYNRDNYIRIKRSYEQKSLDARNAAVERREALHQRYPELKQIDDALAETGMRIFTETLGPKETLPQRLEKVKQDNRELNEARAAWLTAHGYPADYTDIHYECRTCQDTGFVGQKLCGCFRKQLVLASFESSGIGNLIQTQSFETFDTAYYAADPRALENIRRVLAICRRYAEEFSDEQVKNLLFRGATGLGKTHLSTSIAKVIIERGFDVVYDTAQNVLADFEDQQFGHGYGESELSTDTRRYFECDLLILDDLGAEMTNRFTVSCLYNIINTRINHNRSTIMNTNLTWEELRKRYTDRITSRLFGEFMPLEFFGTDIRAQKLRK